MWEDAPATQTGFRVLVTSSFLSLKQTMIIGEDAFSD